MTRTRFSDAWDGEAVAFCFCGATIEPGEQFVRWGKRPPWHIDGPHYIVHTDCVLRWLRDALPDVTYMVMAETRPIIASGKLLQEYALHRQRDE